MTERFERQQGKSDCSLNRLRRGQAAARLWREPTPEEMHELVQGRLKYDHNREVRGWPPLGSLEDDLEQWRAMNPVRYRPRFPRFSRLVHAILWTPVSDVASQQTPRRGLS